LTYEFDLVALDPSDANTNNTIALFSDDTNDKSRRSTNPEMELSTHQEDEVSVLWAWNLVAQNYKITSAL
jgi:pseudo-response regulator 1